MTPEDKIEFFDSKPFIDAANILVASDDPLLAIKVLESLPAAYRDYVPAEIEEVKHAIYEKLATASFYFENPSLKKLAVPEEYLKVLPNVLRWQLIEKDVKELNERNVIPHLVDLGPGDYYLPLTLKHLKYKFTYFDISLCHMTRDMARQALKEEYFSDNTYDRPVIFIACEIIEHLHHERDILVECRRARLKPDILHISTPKYTFDNRACRLDWREFGDLGHLRTYTLNEFYSIVKEMFPNYELQAFNSKILHIRGTKKK